MYTKLALLIDGEWIEGTEAGSEIVLNPATEQPLGALAHAGTAELDRALMAASRAFEGWKRTSPSSGARSCVALLTSCASGSTTSRPC
ncbi:aldehyde dehydrogenase family protein [Methylobacterium nodulans]|uniref:aldehyde dehydrogenase family protein n=1 Tax=Methylobacterium nodulans TaxID=114616 RepID=UPI001FCCB96B|nr:aldehyde dehydrogenase family protein [Methylobacterium nodulans]